MIETVLTEAELKRHALALRQARAARTAIEPPSETTPALGVADAYAIAQLGVEARLAAGARVTGAKIGLTAPAVQAQLGVDSPDYGTLLDEMELVDGSVVDVSAYIAPRVELEVAFVLGAALSGPGVTADDVRAATAGIRASLELVDSRVRDWRITLADTVADAASSAGYVLGSELVPVDLLTAAGLAASLYRDGELVETGHTSAVLGDPCASVAWLANALGAHGQSLRPGEIVLSGACTRMVAVQAGERFRGVIAGVSEVSLGFAGGDA